MILVSSFDAAGRDSKITMIKATILSGIAYVHLEVRVFSQLLDPNKSELTKNLNGYRDHYAC